MLKFFAREDQLVFHPASAPLVGQSPRYVGRSHNLETGGFPAYDASHDFDATTPEGVRLAKLVRREHCLWPADETTASHCGVPFIQTEFKDGAHIAKPSKKKG
jgi:hypothetical protein